MRAWVKTCQGNGEDSDKIVVAEVEVVRGSSGSRWPTAASSEQKEGFDFVHSVVFWAMEN